MDAMFSVFFQFLVEIKDADFVLEVKDSYYIYLL